MTQPTDPDDSRYPDQGSTSGSTPSSSYGAPAYPTGGGDQHGAPAYQGGGYQGGGYQQVPQQAPKNGLGIAALVLGILAIVTSLFTLGIGGIIFGVLAIVLGFMGRGKVKKGLANNGGVALAGIITGILGLLAGIVFALLTAFVFNAVSNTDLVSCLRDAGDDQAKVQQCQNDFTNQLDLPTT